MENLKVIDYKNGVDLGPLKVGHLEKYRAWRNDECIRKWCRQRSLIDEAQQQNWYKSQSANPTINMFEIGEKSNPYGVGVCGLTSIDLANSHAEFSIYIGPDYQGKGFGKMALKTLLSYGFIDLGLNMIWGETIGDNPAAKTFKNVGMENTGHRPDFYLQDGVRVDSHIYCITREKWQSTQF
jgi:RimJ/RimL family protein N-acetyltransferase